MDNQDFCPEMPEDFPPETFRDDEFRDTFGEGEDLERAFQNAVPQAPKEPVAPQPQKPKAEPPVVKGRPKKKNTYGFLGIPHLLATCVWIGIIVAIGVSAGRMLWLCATDILAFGREPITATVTIEKEDSIEQIAGKLKEAGLIRYTGLFKMYADLTDAADEIRPGTYVFNEPDEDTEMIVYDYMALKSTLSPSAKYTVVEGLRIPEGYTCAQIFKLLEKNNVCSAEDLEAASMTADLSGYWFLEGVVRDNKYCLEGYLFPNTYDFYENDDPERVLRKLLNAFDANFTESMRKNLAKLNETLEEKMRSNGYGKDYIEKNKYTIREVVIVASMIEKETANNAESFIISSVIYNRLCNASKFPFLNIDATLVYALGGRELTAQDKTIESPYNTYTKKGLIPGPISNPSQNSLAAALQPEDTDYYYYALNPATGEHHFTKTYKEHQDFLATLRD